jgi:cytochrome c biogenesis protein ResB
MRWLWARLVSLRTTAILLAVLAVFLVINVALPQQPTNPEGFVRLARSGPVPRFVLTTLGLGNVATSAPFLVALGLFFANLAAVLVERLDATLRRLRLAPPTGAQLRTLMAEAQELAIPAGSAARVQELLETLGYRIHRVADGVLWGVKHRFALLGFPLFHAAFFVLAVGGFLLYATRDVVTVQVAEGQTVSSANGGVVRRAPLGAPPPVVLTALGVEIDLEAGVPLELATDLQLEGPEGSRQVSRINHPAVWGDLTVLTERAGIAPVLWLVDRSGFTVDRVAVLAAGPSGLPTRVSFLGDAVEVAVEPVKLGPAFPEREALATTPVTLRIKEGGKETFGGALRPGEAVEVGGGTLKLQEVRYWVGLRLVSERGGGWLVAGFVLSVFGIVWRMAWHRREVAVVWNDGCARIGGRSEFYPGQFRIELDRVRALIEAELGGERTQ